MTILSDDGLELQCLLRGRFRKKYQRNANFIRVGDYVTHSLDASGTRNIESVQERKTSFFRLLPNSKETKQVIAANVDQIVLIVALDDPAYKTGFIDRLSVLAHSQKIDLVLCINKCDLYETLPEFVQDDIAVYKTLVKDVLLTSVHENKGLDKFKACLTNKTSVLVGPSGVGKSSLVNWLDPNLDILTHEVSESSKKGQHTTTLSRLYSVNENLELIDTPGVRELGLVDMEKEELNLFFPDFSEARESCKFYNCTHINEPKCAVLQAVEEGAIYETRYYSYVSMFEELKEREKQEFS